MATRAVCAVLALGATSAAAGEAEGTGRDMLFSDPGSALPDVFISTSVRHVAEGDSFAYTVVLTHTPGMREDETVDMLNDEVRIYLTSSQEVYQQDDSTTDTPFEQRVGHRTQLVIDTDVASVTLVDELVTGRTAKTAPAGADNGRASQENGDGPVQNVHMGPVPYVYVAYSTKNPTQASPRIDITSTHYGGATDPATSTAWDNYKVVCPLCTHEAYCTQLESVIPGTAFAAGGDGTGITDDNRDTETNVEFDGCLDILYNGFAPVYDRCSENGAAMRASAGATQCTDDRCVTEVYVGYMVESSADPTANGIGDGLGQQEVMSADTISSDPTAATVVSFTGNDPSEPGFDGAATGTGKPNGPAPGIPFGNAAYQKFGCYPAVANFDGMHSLTSEASATDVLQVSDAPILKRVPMGGEDPKWLQHVECWDKINGVWADCAGKLEDVPRDGTEPVAANVCKNVAADGTVFDPTAATPSDWDKCKAGSSDYRIRADGSPVTRDIPRIDNYCRYCDRPGLMCDIDGDLTDANRVYGSIHIFGHGGTTSEGGSDYSSTEAEGEAGINQLYGRECVKDTVNGGDTAPNLRNWKMVDYVSGPSWRGDLSSGAQLVFDSTNWDTPQTVVVTARDDKVYEPQVYGRGQDAYVHHYVVAQDINMQHTYYEDIDVNDVVVSIADNDAAYVVQEFEGAASNNDDATLGDAAIAPTEGEDASDRPQIKLKLSSEPMYDVTVYVQSGDFTTADGLTVLPDDEQVIFQDTAQYAVCFDAVNGLRKITTTADVNVNSVGGSHADDCTQHMLDVDDIGVGDGNYASGANTLRQGWDGRSSVHACDPNGVYVRPEEYKDSTYDYETGVPGLPTGWVCPSLSTEATCTAADPASGCAWQTAYNTWVDSSQPAAGVCIGWDDKKVGNTQTNDVASPFQYTNTHDGTYYPVEVAAADQAACENTANRWNGNAAGSVSGDNDGCTDDAGAVLPNLKSQHQCLKTGNRWIVAAGTPADGTAAGEGFCKDIHGLFLSETDGYDTKANCESHADATFASVYDAGADGNTGGVLRGHCVDSMVGRSPDTIGKGRATKSMDIVCAQNADSATCLTKEGCFWDASIIEDAPQTDQWPITAGGLCKAEKLGFDCNSYLVFTSTNWNVLQTLDVIAVQDDEDETAAYLGTDTSSIGYLYTSRDWYFNSVGSQLLGTQKTDYTPSADLWSSGTPDAVSDVSLSMFDTRFGLHINRYPWTKGDAELGSCVGTPTADANADCADTAAFLASGLTADCPAGCVFTTGRLAGGIIAENGAGLSRTSVQNGLVATTEACLPVGVNTDPATDCATGFVGVADDAPADGYYGHAEIETARASCEALTGCDYTAPQDGIVADDDVATLNPVLDYRVQGQIYKDDGKHVHNEYGVSTWIDYLTQPVTDHQGAQVTTLGGHYDEPMGYLDEPHYGFMVANAHTTVANNHVCLAANFPTDQVYTFSPETYANSGATCGATNNVVDTNLRKVLISRDSCSATEGRRFYHKNFNHQKNPTDLEWNGHLRTYTEMPAADTQSGATRYEYNSFGTHHRTEAPTKLPVTLGLFTDDSDAGTSQTALENDETVSPSDLWTAHYLLESEAALYGGTDMLSMSMPVCPFTIVLETSPLEGATVVIKVFEDSELVDLRDNELYFYEEPTFRNGVISEEECENHFPGSLWIADHDGGSCYIQNVPYVVGAPTYPSGLRFKPRGGKSIDVMFTDRDWDVPRRITTIALNDDVDEPKETRNIYFDTAPCSGTNHNPGTGHTGDNHGTPSGGEACIEDPLYNDAKIYTETDNDKDYITVTVVDDDIADLVVLCGDNAGGHAFDLDLTSGGTRTTTYVDSCSEANDADAATGMAACLALAGCSWTGTVCAFDYEDDEMFIGSYDDSHPHNRWDEQIERVGADAEDGMSYSRFGGGISTFFDGITGIAGESDCPNCGYVSIITLGDTNDAEEALMNRERCIKRDTEHLSKLVEESVYPLPSFVTGEVFGETALAVPGSGDNSVVADKTEEGCYPDATQDWLSYDPYSDTYCSTANTDERYGPHCGSHTDAEGVDDANHVDIQDHVRGFKGTGPANTEAADSYVCTIHSRECKNLNGAETTEADLEDSENNECEYGDFKVRLNSSPGTKRVRRQYVGTTETDTEEETVYIVVTPDQTPQTSFSPASVTFTHAGGNVDGVDTYRWDEPATIKVVPIDDEVDERMGVIIDFTAFTITQSHKFDEYWKYTTPYMDTAETGFDGEGYPGGGEYLYNTGAMCEWATTASGNGWSFGAGCPAAPAQRNDDITPYRHTIRTIHTMDNDFSGVRIESQASDAGTGTQEYDSQGFTLSDQLPACTTKECVANKAQIVDTSNPNYYTHLPTPLTVTEGSTFTYYTIQLDTQPRKVQRQSGTDPSQAIIFTPDSDDDTPVCYDHSPFNWDAAACTWNIGGDDVDVTAITNLLTDPLTMNDEGKCNDVDGDGTDYDGPEHGEFFADWTDRTRPDACGSVEPEQDYWVDVTVTQTVHVDLSVPASCPAGEATPWGGGKEKTATWDEDQRHPRFPFNGKGTSSGPSSATDGYRPFNELTDAPSDMDGYLSTCGGWQRDATYRFTADNWNIPQYVYVYAHNDKDSHDIKNLDLAGVQPDPTQHVAHGGNEQTDSSVGHDPTPNLDSDGRTGTGASGSVVGDYGVTEGNYICNNEEFMADRTVGHTADSCAAVPGCVWDTNLCKWSGSRPEYFDRATAKVAETYTTVLRHYVETQDTLDNMQGTGFVQWNKHGGLYTYGNIERFPFGINRYSGAPEYGKLDETGSSTWGYSKYESLYGYGFYKDGVWTTEGCCSTAMGGNWGTTTGGIDVWGTKGPRSKAFAADVGSWGGIGGTDTNELGHEFQWASNSQLPATDYATDAADQCRFAVSQRDLDTYSQRKLSGQQANLATNPAGDRWRGPGEFTRGVAADEGQIDASVGATSKASQVPADAAGDCYDHISGNKLPRPYFRQMRSAAGGRTDAPIDGGCSRTGAGALDATTCPLTSGCSWESGWYVTDTERRAASTGECGFDGSFWEGVPDGSFCTPVSNGQFCTPRFATSYQTNVESEYTLGARSSSDRSTGDAMKFPPLNVWIAVVDNDAQRELTTSEIDDLRSTCKQTSMFQFADAKGSGSGEQNGVTSSKWLTDYNCVPDDSNRLDAGVLPGYPVDTSTPPAATDASGVMQSDTAAPGGLMPNLGVGTEAKGAARVDGGAHLCTAAQVFCPAGSSAAAQASVCQDTNCNACTDYTTMPAGDDISGAADVCCPDGGCKVNAKHLCPAAQVFCPAASTSATSASTCQDTNCNACTGFTTEPNSGDLSAAGDVCV